MIHGLGYGPWGWGPAGEYLARDFELVHVANPHASSVAELAENAAAALDEPAHVLGTSLGGMIAQELALTRPELVDRLVLACTTAGGADAYPMPEVTVRLMTEAATLAPAVALRRFVANALGQTSDGLVDEITALRLQNPPDPAVWQAHAAAGATFDASARVEQIAAPTLVLTGTADNVVDWRNSELLARKIRSARLETFDGCGHLFFWEEPERFAQAVKEFLC
jgi:pimeloyl-ACP methyl ester carboxylesterase